MPDINSFFYAMYNRYNLRYFRQARIHIRLVSLVTALFLVLWSWQAYSQLSEADSLLLRMQDAKGNERAVILNRLGLLMARSKPELALKYVNEALEIAVLSGDISIQAHSWRVMGNLAAYGNDYSLALEKYETALALSEQANDSKLSAAVMTNMVYVFEIKGEYGKALRLANKNLRLKERLNDRPGIAQSCLSIGSIFQQTGKFDSAFLSFKQALVLYHEISDSAGMANANNNIGNVFFSLSNYDTAIHYLIKSLRIKETLGDEKAAARSMNNIAAVYYQTRQFQRALDFYNRSLVINIRQNDELSMATCYGNIGLVHYELGGYDSAQYYYGLAYDLYSETGSRRGIASTLTNLGLLHADIGAHETAIDHLKKALEINTGIGDEAETSLVLQHLGSVYLAQGNIRLARQYTSRSLELAGSLGISKQVMECHKLLSSIYSQSGDYKQAFGHISKYQVLRDSLFNEEKNIQISRIMERYELEKRENRIGELTIQKENAELQMMRNRLLFYTALSVFTLVMLIVWLLFNRFRLRKKQQHLASELRAVDIRQRLLRAQLNPHAISNSLNTLKEFVKNNDTDNAQSFLSGFSRLLRLILENTRNPQVPLASEMALLKAYLELERMNAGNALEFEIDHSLNVRPDQVEIPSMMIQPFVENSVKHGLKPLNYKGIIRVYFDNHQGRLRCLVEDNGIGREKAALLAKGKAALNNSLGTRLIAERIQLLNQLENAGISVEITDLYDDGGAAAGTRVELLLPMSEITDEI